MFSISAVGVHAATPAEVKTKEKVVNLEDAKIVSQSPKVDLPSDNPNIKKYQVTTVYDNGIKTVDVMIDEKIVPSKPSSSDLLSASLASSAQRVRLETDCSFYGSGDIKVAYVRAVGLFEYIAGSSVRVITTYGTGITPVDNRLFDYSCQDSVGYWMWNAYVDAKYTYRINADGIASLPNSGKVTVGCDKYGNRV